MSMIGIGIVTMMRRVEMVIHPFPFPKCERKPLSRRLCMIMITTPPLSQKTMSTPSLSKKKSKTVEKKSLYYHDRCPSTFPEDEESFSEETLYGHDPTPFLHPFPFPEKDESFSKDLPTLSLRKV